MPVITIANSKGGVGKSTTALILATMLAEDGASVTVLDCDPNRPIMTWRGGQSASKIEVIGDTTENNVLSKIDFYRAQRQFVIVDLEGTASRLTSRALSRAQLVLVPIQASAIDADQAARAIGLVREEEHSFERKIPYRVAFTRTSPAITSRIEKRIVDELREGNVPTMQTHLHERAAFKAMFYFKLALDELDPKVVNGLDHARENAALFAAEIIDLVMIARQEAA
jgi:chromosome partitioning protein